MYEVGVFPGKFCPPHRGHLSAILHAATQCKRLYVIVSYNKELEDTFKWHPSIKPATLNDRVRWLSIELQKFSYIKVIGQNETGVPLYPYGWEQWSKMLRETVPEPFQALFGTEKEYSDEGYTKYFPEIKYELFNEGIREVPVSATQIREDPYRYWDYILGAARPHFAKRVLICGTESCGKTTLTMLLAKYYNTSWTEEEGRYYSTRYLGGNEKTFSIDDFFNIGIDQREVEEHALRTSNKLVFFDTDSVITQYYCELYTGKKNPKLDVFIDPFRYDVLLFLTPDVEWVLDGFRFKGEQQERERLSNYLLSMYQDYGFQNIIVVSGNYKERLMTALSICDTIIKPNS